MLIRFILYGELLVLDYLNITYKNPVLENQIWIIIIDMIDKTAVDVI